MTVKIPKIAILGISLESNRFAPTVFLADFKAYAFCRGNEVLNSRQITYWLGGDNGGGFIGAMNKLGPWQPAPILVADAQSGGPCDHEDYEGIRDEMLSRLQHELPLDGVYIIAHGAGITTASDDLDGDYFSAVRTLVGKNVPIVATLDLHANISPAMRASTDALIAQQTNPHIDSSERAAEAAKLLWQLLHGHSLSKAFVRVPLITPQVSQLTAPGTPYGDIMAYAQSLKTEEIFSISVVSGFAFSDTAYNGMGVYAAGTSAIKIARCVKKVAQMAWHIRARFKPNLISVDDATEMAQIQGKKASGTPLIFADVADNPGGGGTGNTMWLLKSFYEADVKGALIGIIHAPEVVADAVRATEGQTFIARFNKSLISQYAEPFNVEATVTLIKQGDYLSTTGVYQGSVVPLGMSCVLTIKGLTVIVVSTRQQVFGADCFAHFGLDVTTASSIVVKSRGHFRAGFKGLVPDKNIFEVDAPGLATPNLSSVPWQGLTRPIYPLDEDMHWPSPTSERNKP